MKITEMPGSQCNAVLAANRVAMLACSRENRPYVVPIFYAYAGGSLYVFSMPGRKIETLRANPYAALLVEEGGGNRGEWKSVVVEGRFEELPDRIGFKREREHAWSLLSKHANWWEPGALKPTAPALSDHSAHVFFRIEVSEISGRQAIME